MTRQILVVMTRQIRVMTRHLTTKYAYNTPKNAYYTRTKKKFFFQFLTQIGNSYLVVRFSKIWPPMTPFFWRGHDASSDHQIKKNIKWSSWKIWRVHDASDWCIYKKGFFFNGLQKISATAVVIQSTKKTPLDWCKKVSVKRWGGAGRKKLTKNTGGLAPGFKKKKVYQKVIGFVTYCLNGLLFLG